MDVLYWLSEHDISYVAQEEPFESYDKMLTRSDKFPCVTVFTGWQHITGLWLQLTHSVGTDASSGGDSQ